MQRRPATWKPAERARLFEWVLNKKLPGLVRFAYGALRVYAPGATLEDAREAVAEKIKDAWRFLDTFDPAQGSFLRWLYISLWRHCARRGVGMATRHRREVPLESETSNQPGTLREWADASALTPERQVQILAIRQGLDRLPARLRDVLKMQYGVHPYTAAMSVQEIADAQHISLNNAKQRLLQARHQLKVLLAEEE